MFALSNSKKTSTGSESSAQDGPQSLQACQTFRRDLLCGLDAAYARIEFTPDGTILETNDAFQQALGYSNDETAGKHHRMFVDPEYARSAEYREFWKRLAGGEVIEDQFPRYRKDGSEIWIQASYIPIKDDSGTVKKVMKLATDRTEKQLEEIANSAKLKAIDASQAVIEFNAEGEIQTANDNFLHAVGYSLSEIQGKNHSIFVCPEYRNTTEYREFWNALRRGEFQAGKFKRFGRGGAEIWIQATYSPITNAEGTVTGVIKCCSDVTEEVRLRERSREVGEAVASSSEQMVCTINEISSNVTRTAEIAESTTNTASTATDAVTRLEECSREIERVMDVIQDLADQTNLLALNATIESARAGEAGKSFAVVAGEVKNLATQTGSATQNIEESIKEIRSAIASVVGSTGDISKQIGTVNGMMNTIATAVEEQSATMAALSETALQLREDG